MVKGQISFDMIFALMMMLLFAQLLINLSDDIIQNQHRISIKSQERQIAINLGRLDNHRKIMDFGGDSSFEYQVPMITAGGYDTAIDCNITWERIIEDVNGLITITVDPSQYSETTSIIETKYVTGDATSDGAMLEYSCGDLLVFSNSTGP